MPEVLGDNAARGFNDDMSELAPLNSPDRVRIATIGS
jgi:hypothetical protein